MASFRTEDGTRLAYRDEGHGFPLLVLAGLTRDGRDFDYLARHLPDNIRLIRLDSRGRGGSDWTGAATYTVGQEASDALALLDHLGLERVALLGSSRGGLIGLVIGAMPGRRLLGLCLNDVGPVIERAGLERIGTYIGVEPTVRTLEEVVDRMPAAMPGFDHVPPLRWQEEAVRHYVQLDGRVGLTYDPALRMAFDAAMAGGGPLPDLWPQFDACAGMPMAVIRGENSDVLSRATVEEIRRRRPDLLFAEIPGRGHVPFLDETEALSTILEWLSRMKPYDQTDLNPERDTEPFTA
ncbi:alpha/beta fold hydrolase [Neotabrizicola shimadae]|uniref:Alpha/beta hydrolase n=1 Tax=Neotabrizicola shimadae TaxID=2807096 RepID=A0A8G0ZW72_9RHOB|nr:alpha/beta hydrolase [Neotabrizicola shimadae]QYZ70012.1 alpha/beta hydrolase [Neotabrizicola shimadae]